MICKDCGTENKDLANFCKTCGAKLEPPTPTAPEEKIVFCTECGTQNSDAAAFCKNCGTQLKQQPGQAAAATVQSTVNKAQEVKEKVLSGKGSKKKIIAIAAIVVIICGLICYSCSKKDVVGVWYDTNHNPSKTSDYNLELMEDGSAYCNEKYGNYEVDGDTIIVRFDDDEYKLVWDKYDDIQGLYYAKGEQFFTKKIEDAQRIYDIED